MSEESKFCDYLPICGIEMGMAGKVMEYVEVPVARKLLEQRNALAEQLSRALYVLNYADTTYVRKDGLWSWEIEQEMKAALKPLLKTPCSSNQ